jgi:hypothetical protein
MVLSIVSSVLFGIPSGVVVAWRIRARCHRVDDALLIDVDVLVPNANCEILAPNVNGGMFGRAKCEHLTESIVTLSTRR